MRIKKLREYNLGLKPRQVRSCEVDLGCEKGMLFAYSEEANCDPWDVAYISPLHPLHLAVYGEDGQQLWHKELGRGVIPGHWFFPFIALDMDKDGVDEVWILNNTTPNPMRLHTRVVERLDARTGETIGTYPFPAWNIGDLLMCEAYRYMLIGGYVNGEPVLVMQQGTYTNMYMQCYNSDMSLRWSRVIEESEGPRASHHVLTLDFNNDGIDEIFFGERLISLDTGEDLICCGRDSFWGHSDVVVPFVEYNTGKGYIYTCRENRNYEGCPRVVMYDYEGNVVWQDIYTDPDIDQSGHMHGGYVFNQGPEYRKLAVAIHVNGDTYVFDALTGNRVELDFDIRDMRPIDINGDGFHEFLYPFRGEGFPVTVCDEKGKVIKYVGGTLIQIGKWNDFKGEQILTYYEDEGVVRMWGDVDAEDSEIFKARYQTNLKSFMKKMTGNGYNFLPTVDCCG